LRRSPKASTLRRWAIRPLRFGLLGVGAERVVDVADLLWPYASNPTLLAHEDTVRDAVRFLAAAYPGLSVDRRSAFEVEALRPDLFADERHQRWWRRTLSIVDEANIITDPMRAFRAELAAANELGGNPPVRSMTMSWGSTRRVTRSLFSREGVNVNAGIDARMLAQSEALFELVQGTPPDSEAVTLAALWAATEGDDHVVRCSCRRASRKGRAAGLGSYQQRCRAACRQSGLCAWHVGPAYD